MDPNSVSHSQLMTSAWISASSLILQSSLLHTSSFTPPSMKCTSFLLFAAITLSTVIASPTTHLRGLASGPEMVDFAAANQVASFNGLHAGEQVLTAVNDALADAKKIDSDQLLSIAKRIATKDASLFTADEYTQKVVSAVRVAFGKLFPGENEEDALRRVLPLIPNPAAVRRLELSAPLESIDFTNANQIASFNGIHAGEEILAAVNKITPNVDGQSLVHVGQMMATGNDWLSTADERSKQIGAAFSQVVGKLFPGESLGEVLKRLLPLIPGH